MIARLLVLSLCTLAAVPAVAQPAAAPAVDVTALAKEQQNPISSLTSIPLQFNFDTGGGLEEQTSLLLNAQPVIPFRLTSGWNAISRTVFPITSMPGPDGTRYAGIGDIQLQLFITPARKQKVIWGAGPVVSAPTATTTPLETGSWALGPTFVTLTMSGPWVVGALMNNVWTISDTGADKRVNQFLLQPFINFNLANGWAIATVPIITANWEAESGQQWTVPVGVGISRTTVFSGRPMVLSLHYYHNVVRPDTAPSSQLRMMCVLLFPKR